MLSSVHVWTRGADGHKSYWVSNTVLLLLLQLLCDTERHKFIFLAKQSRSSLVDLCTCLSPVNIPSWAHAHALQTNTGARTHRHIHTHTHKARQRCGMRRSHVHLAHYQKHTPAGIRTHAPAKHTHPVPQQPYLQTCPSCRTWSTD